jgi:hypothetical protein
MKRFRTMLAGASFGALLAITPAFAASSTIILTPGSGGPTMGLGTDGTDSLGMVMLCGGAAPTLYTTCANQVEVNTSGQLSITGPVTNAGTFAVQFNSTPSLASGNGVVPTQGGAVLSATNGMYTNLLQGNAAVASGNPLFEQLTAGTAIVGKVDIDQTTPGTTNGTDKSSVHGVALGGVVSNLGTLASGTPAAENINMFMVGCVSTVCNPNGSAVSASASPVVVASDQAAIAVKAASGVFVAGAIADLAHGQGAMAASVPIVIASNQSAQASAGQGATGSAPPSGATYAGAVTGGATGGLLVGIIQANASVSVSDSASGLTQLVALSSGRAIYITSFDFTAGGGANTVQLEYGTGTACATGTTALTGANSFVANGGISKGGGLGAILFVPAGDALCLNLGSATSVTGSISYAQF